MQFCELMQSSTEHPVLHVHGASVQDVSFGCASGVGGRGAPSPAAKTTTATPPPSSSPSSYTTIHCWVHLLVLDLFRLPARHNSNEDGIHYGLEQLGLRWCDVMSLHVWMVNDVITDRL
jgi:hypothetical protein